jgi:hypothetical protein
METVRDPKFSPKGKVRTVNASITQTNTSSLALVLVAIGMDGKVDSPTYTTLGKKWSKIPAEGKGWYHSQHQFRLGQIQNTAIQSDCQVLHMLCLKADGTCDTKALGECFKKVQAEAKSNAASIHVSSLLTTQVPAMSDHLDDLLRQGVNVFLYQEPSKTDVATETK